MTDSYWKPANKGYSNATSVDIDADSENVQIHDNNSNDKSNLVIYKYMNNILYALEKYNTIILIGETGSGKSTQLPQILYNFGWCGEQHSNGEKTMLITQPRRIAAITLATRVAFEMNCKIGECVGYAVRFDSNYNKNEHSPTAIKYVTDGLLLNEMKSDPLLLSYGVIMVDDAHERTLHSDVLLGLLKKIQRKREQLAKASYERLHKDSDLNSNVDMKVNRCLQLKLIISSATMDASRLQDFFESKPKILNTDPLTMKTQKYVYASDTSNDHGSQSTCCICSMIGRTYPVELFYTEQPVSNYITSAVDVVIQIHEISKQIHLQQVHAQPYKSRKLDFSSRNGETGAENCRDILVFLPTSEDVDNCVRLLEDKYAGNGMGLELVAFPLYGALPKHLQMQIFSTELGGRHIQRVIIATNIAESSVTIPNIGYVVDSGLVKMKYLDISSGVEVLMTCVASKASMNQRSGRAGRTGPGKCYRLMTEDTFNNAPNTHNGTAEQAGSNVNFNQVVDYVPDFTIPEMQRIDISMSILLLKAIGIQDVLHFDFLSPPPPSSMIYALELLVSLGAIEEKRGTLTDIGVLLSNLPLEPKLGKVLYTSCQDSFPFTEEMLSIIAMCSVGYPFITSKHTNKQTERGLQLKEAMNSFVSVDGDHMTLLNIIEQYDLISLPNRNSINNKECIQWCNDMGLAYKVMQSAIEIRKQLKSTDIVKQKLKKSWTNELEGDVAVEDPKKYKSNMLRKCLLSGFFANIAKLHSDGCYYSLRSSGNNSTSTLHEIAAASLKQNTGHVAPSNISPTLIPQSQSIYANHGTYPEWIIYNDVVYTAGNNISVHNVPLQNHSCLGNMRIVSKIDPKWIMDVASHYYNIRF